MAKEAKLTSTKRFGPRYGRTNKYKFNKIEVEQRKLHECPYCKNIKVKRIAYGIWECKKCNAKFTGKAYTISKKSDSTTGDANRSLIIEEKTGKEIVDEDIEEDYVDEDIEDQPKH